MCLCHTALRWTHCIMWCDASRCITKRGGPSGPLNSHSTGHAVRRQRRHFAALHCLSRPVRKMRLGTVQEFTGSHSVSCKDCPAPLKMTISVWWENSFNGAPAANKLLQMSVVLPLGSAQYVHAA